MKTYHALCTTLLLVVGQDSQADIIHSTQGPITYFVGAFPQPIDFDVDGNGSIDFSLQSALLIAEGFSQGYFSFSAAPEVRAISLPPDGEGITWLAPVDPDAWIGPTPVSGLWAQPPFGVSEYREDPAASEFLGPWIGRRGYWGFAIQSADGTHYGWMEIEDHHGAALTVHGYAYEQTPGTPIPAGAVPEPDAGVLLLLGLCIAGIYSRGEGRAEPWLAGNSRRLRP